MKLSSVLKPATSLILLTLLCCGNLSAGSPPPIKIGFVGDFSSVSRIYTNNAFLSARMFIAELNADGGLLGRPVQLIHRDGGNTPDRHHRLVTDLVKHENVVAIFGGASSPCVLQASAACRGLKVPYLVSIGNSQSIVVENGHPFVFMFEPNTRMESLGFSIFASLMPWRRFAWIGPDYSWGQDVLKFFKQHFEEIGFPIEWRAEVWHPLGATDYSGGIDRIIAAEPDALLVASWGEDLRHFVRQARSRGVFDKVAAFGWFSLIGEDIKDMLPEGIWNISRGPFNYLADRHPQARRFVDAFLRQHRTPPLGFTICCYDSLLAWRQAVLNAGTAAPGSVAAALKGMSFVGLRGESRIRAVDGQLNCPTFFGRLAHHREYPIAVIESVIEIPAEKTWLSEDAVIARRAGAD